MSLKSNNAWWVERDKLALVSQSSEDTNKDYVSYKTTGTDNITIHAVLKDENFIN